MRLITTIIIIGNLILIQLYLYEPKIDLSKVYHYETATFTAYTLSEQETDNDPCIGASGNLCDIVGTRCILATGDRSIPLHTKILVEGIGECIILDRMNIRYDGQKRFDILLLSREEAINFGVKKLKYTYEKLQ